MKAISVAEAPLDFDTFFRDTHRRALAAVYLVTGNRNEAEEIAQDAYVRLYERWGRVRNLEDPEGYLLRTALNVFRDRSRRAARAIRLGFTTSAPRDELGVIEDRDEVVRMLRALAPRERAAVVATSILDLSAHDAARVLGMRTSTVRAFASRGRSHLRHLAKESTR